MKTFIRILTIFFCCFLFVLSASAKEYGWYFKPSANHAQPNVFDGIKFPRDYNSLFLGSPDEKVVYLTFDAGYENGNVEKTLDILYSHSAQAAFFILPALVKNNTELVKRMSDEGHLVCNHSYSHKNMAKITSYDDFLSEITRLEDVYREYTGKEMSKYFRPPEGTFSEQMLEFCVRSGMTPVFWSFAYADWDNNKQKDTEWAYEKIMSNVHNGMVLLLHPTSETNGKILNRVLCSLKEQGFRFGDLNELNFYQNNTVKTEDNTVKTEDNTVKTENNTVIIGDTLNAATDISDYRKNKIVYVSNPAATQKIALTFDDGPHPTKTDAILKILAKYDLKATFFVLGTNAEKSPDVLRRVISAGHEIGNHTYSHTLLSKSGLDTFIADVNKNQEYLKRKFKISPILMRPPGGCFTRSSIEKVNALGYKYVLWSWETDTRDWAHTPAKIIINTIKTKAKGGDILLFHDNVVGESHTAEALEVLIPYFLEQGFEFVTVSQLFEP